MLSRAVAPNVAGNFCGRWNIEYALMIPLIGVDATHQRSRQRSGRAVGGCTQGDGPAAATQSNEKARVHRRTRYCDDVAARDAGTAERTHKTDCGLAGSDH